MPNYTDKYKLTKPLQSELYNVDINNENMDKVEKALDDLDNRVTPVEKGGTGATNALDALRNLGLSATVIDINAETAEEWESQAQEYIEQNTQDNRPTVFNIGWQGRSFGAAIAWKTPWEIFAIVYNAGATGAYKFWRCNIGVGWHDAIVSVKSGGTGATTGNGACDNIGAVKKSGDTMTGTLYTTAGTAVAMGTSEMPEKTSMLSVSDASGTRIMMRQYGSNGLRENFNFPATTEPESNVNYYVLTNKSPVTVAQGGTGANSAAGAVENLWAEIAKKIEATYTVTKK